MRSSLPRAPGLPLVGSSLSLLRDPLAFLREAHGRCGPIFEVRAPTRRFVVLAGREANRFASREGRDAFVSRRFWGALAERRGCTHAIIAVDGPEHTIQRKHYGEVLSRRLVDAHKQGCEDLVRDSFGATNTETFEVRDQTRLLVARLVHHCLTRGAPAIPEHTARALMEVFRWESNTLLLGKWPKIALRAPSYRRELAVAERFISEVIEREAAADPDDALPSWFERIREGRRRHPELFTHADVRFATLLPFVAGVDTVGATLGFVLHELLHAPENLRARVRAEVAGAYLSCDGVPNGETLGALPTLRGLVLECLRLYPAAFAIYRTAARDFEFAGHHVDMGTDVLVFTSATHFDAEHFPEPERLDLERHLATAAIVHHHALEMPGPARRFGPVFDPSLTLDPGFRLAHARSEAR